MDKATPSRPKKVKTQPPVVEESEVATPTSFNENKYAPRPKIGKATIGTPNRVETVGLGNLKVITTNGYTDVRSDGNS
jgi:hypothetical protein